MSLSNRSASRGGKGAKGDKAHKVDKSAEAGGSGGGFKSAADKQQAFAGGGGDNATQAKIKQVMELTQRSEEQVCLALYGCDFDMNKACNMLFEIQNEDTWEAVKKKKNRQQSTSKSEQKAKGGAPGGTGDEWNDSQPDGGGGGGDKDKPRNKTGGGQRLHGRHNDSRGWRGREKQENERNLEDGGQSRERRGHSGEEGAAVAPGDVTRSAVMQRGGGSTFNNRPMETCDNSNTWDANAAANHTTGVEENWDEFPGADEWCGTLAQTKVSTPSQPSEPVIEPEPKQVFSRFRAFTRKYPLVRGMLSYGAMWPISSLVQQTIQGRDYTTYDYKKALRFMLYGTFFTAPTLYSWVRLSTYIWPQTTLRVAITKALVEQVSYGPAAMCCFFFGMTLLEGRSVNAGIEEIQHKFFPTYKVGICFWPILQTINFCLINERNRVPFTSVCSMVWTCFMAYMHQLETKELYADEVPLAKSI